MLGMLVSQVGKTILVKVKNTTVMSWIVMKKVLRNQSTPCSSNLIIYWIISGRLGLSLHPNLSFKMLSGHLQYMMVMV